MAPREETRRRQRSRAMLFYRRPISHGPDLDADRRCQQKLGGPRLLGGRDGSAGLIFLRGTLQLDEFGINVDYELCE